jgi:hypothetical protein
MFPIFPALEGKLHNLEEILIQIVIQPLAYSLFFFHSTPTVTVDAHKPVITHRSAQFVPYFSYQSPEVKTDLIPRKFHLTRSN